MAFFQYTNGRVEVMVQEGDMLTNEEASLIALIGVSDTLEEISNHLSGISFALNDGELKVHRTQ